MKTVSRVLALAAPFLCWSAYAQSCSTTAGPEYFNPLTNGDGLRYPLTFGPICWKLLGAPVQPVRGSDGRVHLAYALLLTNSWNQTASVESIEVVNPAKSNAVTGTNRVVTMSNDDITSQLRLMSDASTLDKKNFSTKLPAGQSAIVYFDVTYPATSEVPRSIAHRVTVNALDQHKNPKTFTVLSPPAPLNCKAAIVLKPPFKGDGWVNGNGCCTEIGPHRFVMNSINGSLQPTEAFAIDWVRMDAQGKLFNGDPKKPQDWLGYGTALLAVASGTVVEVMADLPDEVPGKNPDNLTIEQIAGNHVILDLGSGYFAEYDHIAPHSATVHVGDHVIVGQKIALLGNTGNTDAPHLHFQLMDRPSSLDGSALPFVFDEMRLEGRIDGTLADLDAAATKGDPLHLIPSGDASGAKKLTDAMPLSLDVVSFK